MYYSYLYDHKWQSILRASERTSASICHADRAAIQLQIRLPCKVANSYIFQMQALGCPARCSYYRPALNDLRDFANMGLICFFCD